MRMNFFEIKTNYRIIYYLSRISWDSKPPGWHVLISVSWIFIGIWSGAMAEFMHYVGRVHRNKRDDTGRGFNRFTAQTEISNIPPALDVPSHGSLSFFFSWSICDPSSTVIPLCEINSKSSVAIQSHQATRDNLANSGWGMTDAKPKQIACCRSRSVYHVYWNALYLFSVSRRSENPLFLRLFFLLGLITKRWFNIQCK